MHLAYYGLDENVLPGLIHLNTEFTVEGAVWAELRDAALMRKDITQGR